MDLVSFCARLSRVLSVNILAYLFQVGNIQKGQTFSFAAGWELHYSENPPHHSVPLPQAPPLCGNDLISPDPPEGFSSLSYDEETWNSTLRLHAA